MFKLLTIKTLPNYKLWIEYADGAKGEVDLSHLLGKGVFKLWNEPAAFERAFINSSGAVAWSDKIDLCPDALYMKVTGKTPEQVFPKLQEEALDA